MNDQEKDAVKRKDIVIEENADVATWHMRIEGEIKGTYVGLFKFKCFLLPFEKIAADREYRELLGPNPTFAGQHESFLAYALTQLKHRVSECPPFWETITKNGLAGDLPDENVISAVLDAALTAEIKYRALLKKKKIDYAEKSKQAVEAMMTEGTEAEDDQEDDSEDDLSPHDDIKDEKEPT